MKTTVVPAQVTTVEDKIAGNLGVAQMMLLAAPVFGGSLLFVILPPFFSYAVYKVVLLVCLAVLCGVLAIRIKGQILLLWAVIFLKYNLRPRYFVYDKNDVYLRSVDATAITDEESEQAVEEISERYVPAPLSLQQIIAAETVLASPNASLRLDVTSKGELRVHITENR
jgi:hypothetical protein